MPRRDFCFLLSTATCVLGASACLPSSLNLQPQAVGNGQGAVFGRVNAFWEGEDVTSGCDVTFTKEGTSTIKTEVDLDPSGWIFTSMEPGRTSLSSVVCGGRQLEAKDLRFDIPGRGTIAYFGHITVTFPGPSAASGPVGDTVGATVLFGEAMGGIVAASNPRIPDPWYRAVDAYAEAVAAYKDRYGAGGSLLRPVASLVASVEYSPKPPPATFAGFSLGKDVAAAEASCTGAGQAWQKLDDGQLSCSGAPFDFGVPAPVKVTACGASISKITVDASSDDASWGALLERFVNVSKLLEKSYGDSHSRDTNSLDDCNEEVKTCFAEGRGLTSAIWRWKGDQSLTVTLHGGPSDGWPSLTVVYDASASCRKNSANP